MALKKNLSLRYSLIAAVALIIIVYAVKQLIIVSLNSSPASKDFNVASAIISCSILIFREGLEVILVLSAITDTITRRQSSN